ncbi:hypothetical protein BDB01DRAFT_772381 [Pilobolus umbonatus]|nr:hypothetical protein BDB01DRAFT_772381 [Pilobolus umbonatus]
MDTQTVPSKVLSLSTTAKRRMRTSREEIIILEGHYRKNPNPNQEEKKEIAKEVQMGARNVHFWFQNRRAKDNKKRRLIEQRLHQNQGTSPMDNTKKSFHLPPISTLITPSIQDLNIPFYFHHRTFGIEATMLQWTNAKQK